MKKLIINADDYGLHEFINQGIMEGAMHGCISSTSIMPVAAAFEHAVNLLNTNENSVGVGVHLTLVAASPILEPQKISTLVDAEGNFASAYPAFIKKYICGTVRLAEIYQEFYAQIAKVKSTGIPITHLDSHQHLHVLPGMIDVVIALAKEFKIKAIRIPAEDYLFFHEFSFGRYIGKCGLSFLAQIARKKLKKANIVSPDYFWGMMAGGNMNEATLAQIISQLPNGVNEIMVHPGYNTGELRKLFDWQYHWDQELSALTDKNLLNSLRHNKIELVSFGALANE